MKRKTQFVKQTRNQRLSKTATQQVKFLPDYQKQIQIKSVNFFTKKIRPQIVNSNSVNQNLPYSSQNFSF